MKIAGAVLARADNPALPAKPEQRKGIGKGRLAVSTANSPDDTDSFWIEQIDVDGDGAADDANVIWDDEDKVLYLYAHGRFTCANGKTGSGGRHADRDLRERKLSHKPAGSGWYAVELDDKRVQPQGGRRLRLSVRREGVAGRMRCANDRRQERRDLSRDRGQRGTQAGTRGVGLTLTSVPQAAVASRCDGL